MILIIVLIGLTACVPALLRRMREERRTELLTQQLRESLQCIVHALRTGTGLMQALAYAAKEGAAPLALEWKRVLQAVRLGQSWAGALDGLSKRVPVKEMAWLVAAAQITQQTGGPLSQVLETLASTLQEQQTLREKVKALTAQGKASGLILSALPFLLLGALFTIAPAMVAPMFSTLTGQSLIGGMLLLIAAGGVVIRRIVTIRID